MGWLEKDAEERAERRRVRNRFLDKVKFEGDCWIWTATRNWKGYGQFWFNGKMVQSHRHAYERLHGTIPPGKIVMHSCHTPACVKPSHLSLGTDRENLAHRDRLGRQAHGQRHAHSKLNDEKVRDIRRRYAEGETGSSLAREYGVKQPAISSVIRRMTWAHVK